MSQETIKLLIVDDEPVICQGLRHTIDWKSLGIDVVGEAYSARMAMRLAENHDVDLLLCDIMMPDMDGLQLIEQLVTIKKEIKAILISGHAEFAYAQRAMRLGVADYLLKPVNIDELVQLVSNYTEEIRREKKQQDIALASFFTKCMKTTSVISDPAWSSMEERYREEEMRVAVFALDYDTFVQESSDDMWMLAQLESLAEILSRSKESMSSCECFSFVFENNRVVTILHSRESEKLTDRYIDSMVEEAVQEIRRIEEGGFSCGISRSFRGMDQLAQLYMEADLALRSATLDSKGIVHYSQVHSGAILCSKRIYDMEQKIIELIFASSKEELCQTVQQYVYLMVEEKLTKEAANKKIIELTTLIRRQVHILGIVIPEEMDTKMRKCLDMVFTGHLDSILQLLNEWIHDISDCIQQTAMAGKNHILIETAKRYIKEHFRENMKVAEVASQVHLTSNYFSVVFKKVCGKTFTEYVNYLRIEEAKSLLGNPTLKVLEISERVGYTDYKYFIHMFKKLTNVTPSDYRSIMTA
ncbi:response regulator [Paenibacillus frigoriresistens]|uniref:response regulator n=1 Tax=Paenibacillus alginolyticus TaxID=59839 RepID=UPI001563D64A|nr:response regulator [Paenibacillus frigoriresistens]NRF93587.1 response regulator [Paenibacillus frigoriresistens]